MPDALGPSCVYMCVCVCVCVMMMMMMMMMVMVMSSILRLISLLFRPCPQLDPAMHRRSISAPKLKIIHPLSSRTGDGALLGLGAVRGVAPPKDSADGQAHRGGCQARRSTYKVSRHRDVP